MPKDKVYKQKFRREWLEHPLLRAWLTVRDGPDGTVGECRFCDRIFNPKFSSLKEHNACRKHQKRVYGGTDRTRQHRVPSKLWNHFVRLVGDAARCKYCRAELAHGDSATALEEHLQSEHPTVEYADTQERDAAASEVLKSKNSTKSGRQHFLRDKRKFKIVVCPQSGPQIVPCEIKNDRQDQIEEVIIYDDDASVSEDVTYLEDPLPQSDQEDQLDQSNVSAESEFPPTKHSRESQPEIINGYFIPKKKTKCSKQAKPIVKPSADEDNTIEHFGRYMMSLLFSMPAELANQVQLDIVSMMLSAKMRHEAEQKAANMGSREEVDVGSDAQDIAS